jgi:hypothetical protein
VIARSYDIVKVSGSYRGLIRRDCNGTDDGTMNRSDVEHPFFDSVCKLGFDHLRLGSRSYGGQADRYCTTTPSTGTNCSYDQPH